MDLNASLIEQRVRKLVEDHADALARGDAKVRNDPDKLASRAFTALCVQTLLDQSFDEALEHLTDAGHDLAIDALVLEWVRDFAFGITLFQSKYRRALDGRSAFPGSDVLKVIQTIATLFDPDRPLDPHSPLLSRLEELRGLIREGYQPRVRVVLCNNGQPWGLDGRAHLEAAAFPPNVTFEHLNHNRLVDLMLTPQPVDDILRLAGKYTIEGFDYRRVLIGKVRVSELAALLERHGERLLERNIRRYLGLTGNHVNQAIADTLSNEDQRADFYFFNNGVTLTCRQFSANELQRESVTVPVKGLQIINGGQTCTTIQRTLATLDSTAFENTFVLVRLYELAEDDRALVDAITIATNSQSPVDLSDLRANDALQSKLAMGLESLGYTYLRKRGSAEVGDIIRPAEAAEAVMAVIHRQPHLARFRAGELFGPLYDRVFTPGLLPAQVALAVEILRRVRQAQERPPVPFHIEGWDPAEPRWLPYAGHFVAQIVGELLGAAKVDHRTLEGKKSELDQRIAEFWLRALYRIELVLWLEGVHTGSASLQRLSGVFRRGDLVCSEDALRVRALPIWHLALEVDGLLEAGNPDALKKVTELPNGAAVIRVLVDRLFGPTLAPPNP